MSLGKEETRKLPQNIVDAMNALRNNTDTLEKALNVPRETPEVKRLTDTICSLVLCIVIAVMLFAGSMIAHQLRSNDESRASVELAILKQGQSNIKDNRDRMMESYNAQMVPMLEREVKDLKEEVRFQKQMSNTNRVLHEACLVLSQ